MQPWARYEFRVGFCVSVRRLSLCCVAAVFHAQLPLSLSLSLDSITQHRVCACEDYLLQ